MYFKWAKFQIVAPLGMHDGFQIVNAAAQQHSLNQSWRFRQQGVPIERCQTGGQMRSRRVACNMNAGVGVVLMVVLADPSNCRNQLVKHWEQSSAMNAHI